jgi:hypothetical protein
VAVDEGEQGCEGCGGSGERLHFECGGGV